MSKNEQAKSALAIAYNKRERRPS